MKKILVTALLILLTSLNVNAQQSPHYTQYMYNMNIINPAYAGSKESLSFGLLYRKQWLEIEDAPTTFSLSGSAPVGKNVGMGLSIISDKIGPVVENNIYGDFSYTLNFPITIIHFLINFFYSLIEFICSVLFLLANTFLYFLIYFFLTTFIYFHLLSFYFLLFSS
jgi:type IX secretion system PorP/SprF family membrane protein